MPRSAAKKQLNLGPMIEGPGRPWSDCWHSGRARRKSDAAVDLDHRQTSIIEQVS